MPSGDHTNPHLPAPSCAPGCRVEDDHEQPDDCLSDRDISEERQLRRWEDECQERGWVTRRGTR